MIDRRSVRAAMVASTKRPSVFARLFEPGNAYVVRRVFVQATLALVHCLAATHRETRWPS